METKEGKVEFDQEAAPEYMYVTRRFEEIQPSIDVSHVLGSANPGKEEKLGNEPISPGPRASYNSAISKGHSGPSMGCSHRQFVAVLRPKQGMERRELHGRSMYTVLVWQRVSGCSWLGLDLYRYVV